MNIVSSAMDVHAGRVQRFDSLFDNDNVDIRELRKQSFNGIPEESGKRALCWRVLFNYLPPEKSLWADLLAKQRNIYAQFIEELLLRSVSSEESCDHPLSLNSDSRWHSYFKDNEVLSQIDKDVRRLCPDISFFQRATDFPCKQLTSESTAERLYKRVQSNCLKSASVVQKGLGVSTITYAKRKVCDEYAPLQDGQEAHWEVVERILFLYFKLNPGQGYVQGMNEIIGPIYYTYACDTNIEFREHAEADTFFCFTNLMAEIRDFFIKTLDDSDFGVWNLMKHLMDTLKSYDAALCSRLNVLDIKPQYFAFRWLTLLLSQEFQLPDVIRVWDSLLANEKRFHFLIQICCAMILLIKDELMTGDFAHNMKLLQNYPLTDIQSVLKKATELDMGCIPR